MKEISVLRPIAAGIVVTIINLGSLTFSGTPTLKGDVGQLSSEQARLPRIAEELVGGASQPTPPPVDRASNSSTITPQSKKSVRIGIFLAGSPVDPDSLLDLEWAAQAGFDTVFNYAILDGSESQIDHYLDRAQSLNLQVIVNLANLYDQLPDDGIDYPQFGGSNEEIALNATKLFAGHPAVWGFATTDEKPETSDELSLWHPVLLDRYQKIKATTTKPVMLILVGWNDGRTEIRRNFLRSLLDAGDTLALDYYPVPFLDQDRSREIGADLKAVGISDGWFVTQAFSWATYPEVARELGFDLARSRFPTTSEMVAMSETALEAGAANILFYHYPDIAENESQLEAVREAVRELRK